MLYICCSMFFWRLRRSRLLRLNLSEFFTATPERATCHQTAAFLHFHGGQEIDTQAAPPRGDKGLRLQGRPTFTRPQPTRGPGYYFRAIAPRGGADKIARVYCGDAAGGRRAAGSGRRRGAARLCAQGGRRASRRADRRGARRRGCHAGRCEGAREPPCTPPRSGSRVRSRC